MHDGAEVEGPNLGGDDDPEAVRSPSIGTVEIGGAVERQRLGAEPGIDPNAADRGADGSGPQIGDQAGRKGQLEGAEVLVGVFPGEGDHERRVAPSVVRITMGTRQWPPDM